MLDLKLCALILISCFLFGWTLGYMTVMDKTQVPTAISAFNA